MEVFAGLLCIVLGCLTSLGAGLIASNVKNQLDGKVAEVYHLLGDDVITTSYALEAPAGATLGENGVYRIENKSMGALWIPRLESESKRGNR